MITCDMAYLERERTPDADQTTSGGAERRGCLFALSQPPLILFLAVVGALLLIAGAYDRYLL